MMEDDGFILVPRPDQVSFDTDSSQHANHDVPFLSEIDSFIDNLSDKLWPLNKFIHQNPEVAYQEHKAHKALTEYMLKHSGWKVTPSAHGIPTAWIALFDTGKPGPFLSFNAEMDALPNLGHACGHNLIATASVAAALATAHIATVHNLPGKILLLGTPGEEGLDGGKIRLLNSGAYKDVDITLISHPGILNNSPLVRTTAFARLEAEYFGQASHAANSPWKGINALDALVSAYNSISMLRQQTMPEDVIAISIVNGGGETTNVIHPYASGVCVIRSSTGSRVDILIEKIKACFNAGAEATGAKVEIKLIKGYQDHVPNRVLAESYTKYWNGLGNIPEPRIPGCGQMTYVKASTDQGNLSHALPSINTSFSIPPGPEGGMPHSKDFEIAAGRYEAFERALRVGKALAGVAVEVLGVEGKREEVWRGWRGDMEMVWKE
ncbi:hypothetical protein QBC38DRAFT_460963 [Podospora fimiseda]|uniref:Peptidase M20 domain-containing protein 2 n=1 Tax=Podospora fimiseda TaxID=252190 RepID=A0AAN6YNS3_9PEZI|nr:hypothetical protein QBC38DRAFT_460963 [Podospora fimiseda]